MQLFLLDVPWLGTSTTNNQLQVKEYQKVYMDEKTCGSEYKL